MCMLIFKSQKIFKDKTNLQTSLVAQWLRLWASNAGGLGSIPGRVASSHMLCSVAKRFKKKKKIYRTLAIFLSVVVVAGILL